MLKLKYRAQLSFMFLKPDPEIEKFQNNGYLKMIKRDKVFKL